MYFLHCIPVLRFCPTFITILLVFCTTTYILTTKKINVFVCNIRIRSFFSNILVHKRQSLLPKYHTKPVYETVGKSSLPFFLAYCICTVSWIFFMKSPKPTSRSKIAGLLHSERESSKHAISS